MLSQCTNIQQTASGTKTVINKNGTNRKIYIYIQTQRTEQKNNNKNSGKIIRHEFILVCDAATTMTSMHNPTSA